MSDNFETRVRCATAAGWWTLLIAAAFMLLQWVLFLLIVPAQPALLLSLWGPGATWQEVRNWWFGFLICFKVGLGLLALLLVWLTLWTRQLRKHAGSS
jgi:hypothetical protein